MPQFDCGWIAGGYDRGECLRTVEMYDPSLNRWTQLAPMREARGRFDITVIDGKVYAIGGCNGTTELATAEVYNSENGKWTKLPPLTLARSNIGNYQSRPLTANQHVVTSIIPSGIGIGRSVRSGR